MRPPAWTSRGDRWFAGVAAALAGVVGVLGLATAPGPAARVEVAVLSAVTVAGFVVAGRRRLPMPVLAAWTFVPAIVLALRQRGEGTMFLLVVALSFLVLVEPRRWVRAAAGAVAVLTPAGVTLAVHPDWGWPFWTGGIVFGWLSAEQTRRFRALVAELTATRERLAEQAVHLERRRIAAELHDLVGHSLGVLLLHITGARRRVRDDPDAAEEALRQAEGIGRAGLTEIRRSVAALRRETGAALAPTATRGRRAGAGGADGRRRLRGELDGDRRAGGRGGDRRTGGLPGRAGVAGERDPARARRAGPGAGRRTARRGGGDRRQRRRRLPAAAGRRRGRRHRHAGAGGGARRQPRRRPDPGRLAGPCPHPARARAVARSRPRVDRTAAVSDPPGAPRPVTVVLVDDQPLVRAGLRWVLAEADGFTIAAECGDGAEAVAAVQARPGGVDVVLMDVRMRGVDGIEATRRLREQRGPPVLILTTFDEDEVLWGAIEAGAAGFVLKDASAEDLIAATRTVAGGGAWLDPAVTPRVLEVTRRSALPRHRAAARADDLTERELDVLRQMATGASNPEIAAALVVSEATVKTHVGSIFAKLGVRDRAGAIVYAYQHGISSP